MIGVPGFVQSGAMATGRMVFGSDSSTFERCQSCSMLQFLTFHESLTVKGVVIVSLCPISSSSFGRGTPFIYNPE